MRATKSSDRRFKAAYRDWLALQGDLVGRVSSNLVDIADLVGAGSTEPRRWIEASTKLWSGMIGDFGDWIKQESGRALRPAQEWISRCRLEIPQGQKTVTLTIAVPLEAFQDKRGKKLPAIHLEILGVGRVGRRPGASLEPGKHLSFKDPCVKKADRETELTLYDLPPRFLGEVYGGLVWAIETKYPVAALEIEIVE